MYQIALCDDEAAELDKSEEMLEEYQKQCAGCEFSIERFANAQEFLRKVREENYEPDLLLMDIYMPGMRGIEAARKLRETDSQCRIIFLTTSRDYALEAFQVNAAQYLVKPISESELFPVLDMLLGEIRNEQKKFLLLRTDNTIRRVALYDIIYFEAQKRRQQVYLSDGTQLVLRMTMARIYEMLSGHREFVKAGAAYIINLDHVESLNARELKMTNGNAVYLPRGAYPALKEQYFDYYCENE